ncbi:MAG: bifunctional pyr operon transcriptional regulator/uracil phosphoribosyltransferase PyrR [Desulfobacterales bacterium]
MDEIVTFLDHNDIERILKRMTHDILESHENAKNLVLIGIQTRGVFIAKRIADTIRDLKGVDVSTGTIDITLYRDDWTLKSPRPVVRDSEILFSLDGKEIVLVDDVLYTGRTTRAAMDAIIDFGRPRRIELAVLVDRGHRELPVQADYVGELCKTRRTETVNVYLKEYDGRDQVVIEKKAP